MESSGELTKHRSVNLLKALNPQFFDELNVVTARCQIEKIEQGFFGMCDKRSLPGFKLNMLIAPEVLFADMPEFMSSQRSFNGFRSARGDARDSGDKLGDHAIP